MSLTRMHRAGQPGRTACAHGRTACAWQRSEVHGLQKQKGRAQPACHPITQGRLLHTAALATTVERLHCHI
eukprot:1133447-Pelagomonas_calceolata.AAC.1